MLDQVSLCVEDAVWAGILSDLGAVISVRGIKFKAPAKKIGIAELAEHVGKLRRARIAEIGAENLSDAEQRLVLLLPRAAAELKNLSGYADAAQTHTVETLIYNIRKKLGTDFIRLENGVYEL